MLSPIQKQELASGIGASECATILGVNPYQTPYELWLIKTGKLEKDISDEPHIIMGNLLEPVIAKRYGQLTNQKVARVNSAYRHPKYPHILAHIDRKIVGQNKGVEIKTANPFSKEWGEAGTDEIPKMYMVQVQQQLLCSNWESEDLIVFRGTTDLRIYNFAPDKEVMDLIVEQVNHFWFEHVLKDIAPPATTRGDLAYMYPTNNGDFVELTQDMHMTLLSLSETKKTIKTLGEDKTALEKTIIEFIADKDGIKNDDDIIATFKADKNGRRSLRIKGE